MLNTFQALWADERGFIISIELILITTILVLGLIVGMSCLAGDCVDGKVVPGTPLTPIPEQTLPGSSPVPQSSPVPVQPRQSIPSAPVLPPLN